MVVDFFPKWEQTVTVHLAVHFWVIFLFTANTQVCERCCNIVEASVNFINIHIYIATLCCKLWDNVDFLVLACKG